MFHTQGLRRAAVSDGAEHELRGARGPHNLHHAVLHGLQPPRHELHPRQALLGAPERKFELLKMLLIEFIYFLLFETKLKVLFLFKIFIEKE